MLSATAMTTWGLLAALALAPFIVTLARAGSIQVPVEERGVLAIVVGVNGPFTDTYKRWDLSKPSAGPSLVSCRPRLSLARAWAPTDSTARARARWLLRAGAGQVLQD